jgi:hypothetical protein
MSLSLLSRYAFFAVCVIFTLASLPFLEHDWLWPITLSPACSACSVCSTCCKAPRGTPQLPDPGQHPLSGRSHPPGNPPVPAESDSDALPFSRAQRSLVYSRAKNETADKPFGTLIDVYQSGFEFIGHSMRPAPLSDPPVSASPSAARNAPSRIRRRSSTFRP